MPPSPTSFPHKPSEADVSSEKQKPRPEGRGAEDAFRYTGKTEQTSTPQGASKADDDRQDEHWLEPPSEAGYMGDFLNRGFGLPHPYLPLGHHRTFAEAAFYYYLKLLFPDTRDVALGIAGHDVALDLVIPSIMTAVEFDNPVREKHSTLEADITKYALCRACGLTLIRIKETRTLGDEESADIVFSTPDILKPKNLQKILQKVVDTLDPDCDCWNRFSAKTPTSRVQVGLRRDKGKIEAFTMKLGGTSLADVRPDLVKEWNERENAALYPEMFAPDSPERVWWRCPDCEHDYERQIAERAAGAGCPRCARKAIGNKRLTAKRVVQLTLEGRVIQTWESVSAAAKHLNVSASNISLCCAGKRRHAGGFLWRREDEDL